MARFEAVEARAEGCSVRVKFTLDAPAVVGWQLYDPASGAYLSEGEWSEANGARVDLRVELPFGDGPYRVQVAPVADRARFVLIDAELSGAGGAIQPPRVTTAGR